MSFHAKALEIYTASFQHVQNMNEDEVVEVKSNDDISRQVTARNFNTYSAA